MRFGLMVAAVLFASPAFAGDEDVAVVGAGQRSCGQFIAAVGNAPVGSVKQFKSSSNEQYFGELIRFHEWMMGFMTGFNAIYAGDFNSRNPERRRDALSASGLRQPPRSVAGADWT
jgi:hypothetical protein